MNEDRKEASETNFSSLPSAFITFAAISFLTIFGGAVALSMEGFFVLLIIVGFFGILGTWVWFGHTFLTLKEQAETSAKDAEQLTDIKSHTDPSFCYEDLVNVCRAGVVLTKLAKDGKLNINQTVLGLRSTAAVKIGTLKIIFKQHPVVSSIFFLSFFPLPVGWVAAVVFAGLLIILGVQAAQFQVMVREALVGGSNPTAIASAPGVLSTELSKLEALHRAGTINEEEFRAAKAAVIRRAS